MVELISSAANPAIKRIRQLADRKYRRKHGVFFVEGIQPVWQASDSDFTTETLIIAPGLLTHEPSRLLVDDAANRGIKVLRLTNELFQRISDRDGPAGIAAIVEQRHHRLADLSVNEHSLFVALHEISNPGNLGTILRTCEAAGISGLVLIGATCDPFDPAAVKASMGAVFNVPIARAPEFTTFTDWTATHQVSLVATSGTANTDYLNVHYPAPLALLLGSEGNGLPDDAIEAADIAVNIPMTGKTESLNLAVAAGILIYQTRQAIAPLS